MVEPKVRLSIEVPGATMLSSLECEQISKEKAYSHNSLTIVSHVKKGKKSSAKKETIHFYTRNSRPAMQSISITKDAYLSMIDKSIVPVGFTAFKWAHLTNTQRLNYHLDLIAQNFNALSYSYEILDK